jgi:hypothetical protein
MATMVLLASYVNLNSNNLSTYASKIALTVEVEEKDVTTYGSLGWKEVKGGLKSGSLSIMFKNSITDNELDEIMWALLGTVVTFEVRLDNAVVGASNPKYTGSVLIKKWAPISGTVGDVAETDVEYPTSGAVTRAVA